MVQLKDIENIKTVIVALNYLANNLVTSNIRIPFQPNYVVLKQVNTYNYNNNDTDRILIIRTNLLEDTNELCSFPSGGEFADGVNSV